MTIRKDSIQLAVILALVTGWRLWALWSQGFGLHGDEAQYWVWAKNLDFGYYSKPPMVAWAIALTTSLCGDGEFCVRAGAPLAFGIAAFFVFLAAAEISSRRVAAACAVAFITAPGVALSSMMITTDTMLVMFSAMTVYFFIKAAHGGRWRWWLAAGLAAGCGMMSKYNFAAYLPSVFLYLAWQRRDLLASPRLYAALGVAFAVFLPNLWWNFDNGFVSFLHMAENAETKKGFFNPKELAEFFFAQFAVLGPVFFAALLAKLWNMRGKAEEGEALLASFFAPLFGCLLALSLITHAKPHWASPVYVPGMILAVAFLYQKRLEWLVMASIALHVLLAAFFLNWPAITEKAGIERSKDNFPFYKLMGWKEAAIEAEAFLAARPGASLLADERRTAALLWYYTGGKVTEWDGDSAPNDYFEMNSKIERGREYIYVAREHTTPVLAHFSRKEKLGEIRLAPVKGYEVRYEVWGVK